MLLDDPFFVRIPSGLQPTNRATSLHHACGVALAEICSAVAIPMFDPAKTRQRFAISAGHYFCTLVVPSLIALARKSAPALQIVNIALTLLRHSTAAGRYRVRSLLLMKQFHNAADKRALSVTVLRAVCSSDVKAVSPTDFREKTDRRRQGRVQKPRSRSSLWADHMWAAAILTVFGILIALLDDWAP